ncbi:phosphodiesterase YaeI [Oligoflexia bacterium]|nr:phosphodiesterase YaeI [Oligoflexia bacterium]
MAISRRNFILGTAGLTAAGLGYTRFIEPAWISIARHTARLPGFSFPEPIRILHLSDLHASRSVPLSFIEHAFTLGCAEKPDLIFLTGDYITGHLRKFKAYQSILKKLSQFAPTYAVVGNHDGGTWVSSAGWGPDTSVRVGQLLVSSNITFLHNAATTIEVKGQKLTLVGLGDWLAGEFFPEQVFQAQQIPTDTLTPKTPTLILVHNPDTKEPLARYQWQIMFAGHTHGGQIKIPFYGPPYAPILDYRYVEGLKPWKDKLIHVTRGVGNLFGVRFNCRPEVSLVTLV